MAFWKRKTEPTTASPVAPPVPAVTRDVSTPVRSSAVARTSSHEKRVLVRPHLTEKSSVLAEAGQYTFLVTPDAEKISIARAVAARYAVHPIAVHIINLPGKRVRYGKTSGQRSGIKKAIVTLKAGEKIPFGVKT